MVIFKIKLHSFMDSLLFFVSRTETFTYRYDGVPPPKLGPVSDWKARVMDGQGLITFNQLYPWIMMNSPFDTHIMKRERKAQRRNVYCVFSGRFMSSGRCHSRLLLCGYCALLLCSLTQICLSHNMFTRDVLTKIFSHKADIYRVLFKVR